MQLYIYIYRHTYIFIYLYTRSRLLQAKIYAAGLTGAPSANTGAVKNYLL